MLRSLSLIAVLLIAPLALSQQPAYQPAPRPASASLAPIPAARSADSYAIYKLLMPGAPDDKIASSTTQHWVVANTTVNITDMDPAIPPNGLLKAPPENPRAFHEALEDFETRRYQRYRLQSADFHPSDSPPLVSDEQIRELRDSGSTSTGVTFFSAAYFNRAQTAALVYVNHWCAHLCSAGQWVYLEKHDGEWVRRSGLVSGGG